MIIYIIACVLIVLFQIFIIPIIFKVHKTSNRVLSLFGGIPKPEI